MKTSGNEHHGADNQELEPFMRTAVHPLDDMLRPDRIPHIWCPGCGLGPTTMCYMKALREVDIPLDKQVVVSGIGCTGRIAGYVYIDSFHTTHGRPIPFATGMKIANPELTVTVFSGDGDLFAIGGNHFIHAARRNVDINIICVNNFNYGMTGGQVAPTTPVRAKTSTTPYGNYEPAFNLPYVAAGAGAVYVSRWTVIHVRQLEKAIERALEKKGFTFIEIIAPCPTGFGRRNKIGTGLDEMRHYMKHAHVDHEADLSKIGLDIGKESEIVVGNFVDEDKPAYCQIKKENLGLG